MDNFLNTAHRLAPHLAPATRLTVQHCTSPRPLRRPRPPPSATARRRFRAVAACRAADFVARCPRFPPAAFIRVRAVAVAGDTPLASGDRRTGEGAGTQRWAGECMGRPLEREGGAVEE